VASSCSPQIKGRIILDADEVSLDLVVHERRKAVLDLKQGEVAVTDEVLS